MLTAPPSLISVALAAALLATPDADPPPEGEGLWGDVTCESSARGCELGAGDLGDGPRPGASPIRSAMNR